MRDSRFCCRFREYTRRTVFSHSNVLHSAGQNRSDAVKLSLVYTYHGWSNAPQAGTRSASKAEVRLTDGGTDS